MRFTAEVKWLPALLATVITTTSSMGALAAAQSAAGPKTPEAFAAAYMSAYNKKDASGVKKLRYPLKVKSSLQELLDEMSTAGMAEAPLSKFVITPVPKEAAKASMGPDGIFYAPVPAPTHSIKFTSTTTNGTSSSSFLIGPKDGVYYVCAAEPSGTAPAFQFGWQRFTPVDASWSVLLPNEPEPGKAALEQEFGKDALKDPDIFGVVKNTASIKTTEHFYRCGEQGKRVHADDNKETFRIACTTYSPETLKEWYSDPSKTLDEQVDYRVRNESGATLLGKKTIDVSGAPGREFEMKPKDGGLIKTRVIWHNNSLFELTFESHKEKPDVESADKFLLSFESK